MKFTPTFQQKMATHERKVQFYGVNGFEMKFSASFTVATTTYFVLSVFDKIEKKNLV